MLIKFLKKIKHDYDDVADRTNAEAPRRAIWTQAYEMCQSRLRISLVQLSKNMSDKTGYRTQNPAINRHPSKNYKMKICTSVVRTEWQEELCCG